MGFKGANDKIDEGQTTDCDVAENGRRILMMA